MELEPVSTRHISIFYVSLIVFHTLMMFLLLDRNQDDDGVGVTYSGFMIIILIMDLIISGFYYLDLQDRSRSNNTNRKYAMNFSFVIIALAIHEYAIFMVMAYYLFSQHSRFD